DVQWNKNRVFNLFLIIAYFWTTLIVMIILYIFIYGVASNLERKSRENARKMSSLVGMAGNAMTQIGIGVTKSPTKAIDKYANGSGGGVGTNESLDDEEDPHGLPAHSVINTQNSSNSSEQKRDEDNSNSFESHSDCDLSISGTTSTVEKKNDNKFPRKTRRGMSVSGATQTNTPNSRTTRNLNRNKQNVRFFATNMAHSLYRNTNRLSGFSSSVSTKKSATIRKVDSGSNGKNVVLTPIPSEPELSSSRVYPPPQPRPETLAILSDELFHEKLRLRQSPLLFLPPPTTSTSTIINSSKLAEYRPSSLSLNLPVPSNEMINSDENLTQYQYSEDSCLNINDPCSVTQSETTTSYDKEKVIHDDQTTSNHVTTEIDNKSNLTNNIPSTTENITENICQNNLIEFIEQSSKLPIQQDINSESSDESWRLLNSNSSSIDEHIPYIDETDFEDLGPSNLTCYILHRRRVPNNTNEPIREETVVYKSPFYLKHKHRSKTKVVSNTIGGTKYEIYGTDDAQMAILESAIYDNVELITFGANNTAINDLDIQHRSLRNVSREKLLKNLLSVKPSSITMSPLTKHSSSIPNDQSTSSSIILLSQAKSLPTTPLNHLAPIKTTSSTTTVSKNKTIEQALLEFFQCGQLDFNINNRTNDNSSSHAVSMTLTNATLLNENEESTDFEQNEYNEIGEETCSLLRLNEQKSSAFFDDDDFTTLPHDQQMMKKLMLNKQHCQDSDTNQSSHSMSINYSQDFSLDRIYNYESSMSSIRNNHQHQLQQPKLSEHTSSSLSLSIKNPISTTSSVRSSTTSSTRSITSSSGNSGGIKKKVNDEHPQFSSTEFNLQCHHTTSSDSDIITTSSTTLPTNTQFSSDLDQKSVRNSITQDVLRAITKLSSPDPTLDNPLVLSAVTTISAPTTVMHVQALIIPPCKNMTLDSSINNTINCIRLPIQETHSQELRKSDSINTNKRVFNRGTQSSMHNDHNSLKLEINSMLSDKRFSTSDTVTRDNDTSGYGSHDDPSTIGINPNRPSKVTFDHCASGDNVPKTKDQAVLTNISSTSSSGAGVGGGVFPYRTGGLGWSYGTLTSEEDKAGGGNQFGGSDRTGITSGTSSTKSSVKELIQNQRPPIHRKSKSQNRARKALRTITFILGAFVVCWTPWHIYSAVQSLCDACKDNVFFSNTLFHAVYFLCYLNSPINPFCYALANQQFKKTFTRILKLDLRRL
ncbi:unnamed protein product, partial [Didymodactylos carnosus]